MRARLLASIALPVLAWAVVEGRAGGQAAAVPTFNDDVAPIVFRACANCHRPLQAAPMSLLSYNDVRPWALAIKKKVLAREMPPWSADPRFGSFRNDRSLTLDEISTIVRWVDGGAVEGVGKAPPAPLFSEGWSHPSGRPPDVVLQMPTEVSIPAGGQLSTMSVYSTPGLSPGSHFVEAIQLLPGNIAATHHSSLSMRRLPAGVTLGTAVLWPGGPRLEGLPLLTDPAAVSRDVPPPLTEAEAFSSAGASHLIFYFPGSNGFARYPTGVGKRVRAEHYVEWSVHYTPSGQPATDRHRAGLWLHRSLPAHEAITLRVGDFHIVNGAELVLPAGISTNPGHAAIVDVPTTCDGVPCVRQRVMIPPIPPQADNWRITAITPFQESATVYLAYPHGHLRLQSMTYVLTYPDGREETILSVPRFDFNWQQVYEFSEPIRVPAGSTIKVVGRYDNSARNRWNPTPDKTVQWSEQSWDEMFNGFVDVAFDRFETTVGKASTAAPPLPLVTVVGCATTADGRWRLTRASDPEESVVVHADEKEIETAKGRARGSRSFALIGTAEFGSVDELLGQGQRRLFTAALTANATGTLREGQAVGVKGILIGTEGEDTLNVLSAWTIAGACP